MQSLSDQDSKRWLLTTPIVNYNAAGIQTFPEKHFFSKKTSLPSSLLRLKSPLIFPTGISMTRKWLSGPFSVHWFSSVQSLSCIQLFATPWIAGRQASLSIANSRWLITVRWALLFVSDYHAMLWGLQLLHSRLWAPSSWQSVCLMAERMNWRQMDGWMDGWMNGQRN